MTKPLALVFYEKLLPGTQLVNRLQDLGYRVMTVPEAGGLAAKAVKEKPLLVLVDLSATRAVVPEIISQLRQNPETSHLPIIAFADERNLDVQNAAREAGATLVASDSALLAHLEQFLDQALQLD